MFVAGNFLAAIAKVIDIALTLYMWIIIARAVISWVNPDPYNPIVRFLTSVTEPVLFQIRRRL
ncbi:MAG: YggT family protein, partial [Pseudomonadota bacterium]